MRKFKANEIFDGLETPASYEARLEAIRNRLREKYNIEDVQVDAIDKDSKCYFFNITSRDYINHILKTKYMYSWSEIDKDASLSALKEGHSYLRLPHEILACQKVDKDPHEHYVVKSNIVGKYRDNEYTVMFNSNTTGHKIQFIITFSENKSIVNLSKSVFYQLMNDLKSAEDILKPFLEHFVEYGNLKESPLLHKKIQENPFHLSF